MAGARWNLEGRTVLITGAARGIGAESARRLATRGANVSLVGLEPEELQRVASHCGPGAAWHEADVRDAQALETAVEATVERFGSVDAVIANAGIGPMGTVRSVDPAAFEATIDVNLLGVWRTIRACLPQLIERRGYVLVVASGSAATHVPGMAAYAASKAGVEALANCLREEVRHLGVDVGCAYFLFVDTDLVAAADAHPALGAMADHRPPLVRKKHSVGKVAEAVARALEERRTWIVVPGWFRAVLLLRGPLQRFGRSPRDVAAELDERFERDVAQRGAEAASRPVGPGGRAASGGNRGAEREGAPG
jgi:NAD(P)-dependent dehydrogenase (short-subunit alcohol dehydrogenase family)